MMKILLTSPVTPISASAYSHRSAQAEIYAQMIYDSFVSDRQEVDVTINYGNKIKDYSEFNLIYVYHGNDWGGTLNLFGGISGLSDPEGLVALHKFDPKCVMSIAIPMPDYAGLLRKRLKPGEKFDSILDELPERTPAYTVTPVSFEGTSNLVVGDSHAICMYRPGWEVLSVPFKTLHGALTGEGGLRKLVADKFEHSGHFENLEFYFGNIDIRHHLMRQPNPEAAAVDLAERYFNQVQNSFSNALTKAIYEPLPIENESRKLPKTGYYKGTPFYGTWEERDRLRKFFAYSLEQQCKNSSIKFIRWTDYLKNDKGELDFKHMEKPRSVHLARASYPHWRGLNEVPEAVTQSPSTSLESFFS